MEETGKKKMACLKGSYTVEAALVMSVTVFVLGALILLTFYLHDRAVAQSLVCEIATAGSTQENEKKCAEAAQKAAGGVSASRFLGSRALSKDVSAGEKKASARVGASFPVPGFAVQYFSGGELSIDASWESAVLSPSETIRLFRGLGELAGNLIEAGKE